jgi:hypothetical protein
MACFGPGARHLGWGGDIPRHVGPWLLAVGVGLLPPSVAAQNLLINPHFSGDLTGWLATPGSSQTIYDATRSATADGTGSVGTIVHVDGFPGFADAWTPSQCVSGIVAGANYGFGGAVLAPSGQGGGSGRGSLRLVWFASSDCSDQVSLGTAETPRRGPATGDPADTWLAAQANAVAPSDANSAFFSMHGWSISGPSSDYQVDFDDAFLVQAPAPPPQPNGLCSVDPTCSTGGQQRARDAGSGSCVSVSTCSELWMCPQGPVNRSCGSNGVQDCAFSADCGEAVSDCFQGLCRTLGSCNDRVKFHGYSQTPDANQCSCAGNPPAAGGACGPPPPPGACTADGQTACLNNGRFEVQASFDAGSMGAGAAHLASLSSDTAYLWFFSSTNAEAMLKVLDGCGVDGHYWVFVGGLTNVAVTITVTDTASHAQKIYQNPAGTPFAPIQDIAAFAACP